LARSKALMIAVVVMSLGTMAFVHGSHAQPSTPPGYTTQVVPTNNAEIDAAILESSLLVRLQDEPLGLPVALIGRARADADRVNTILRALGYFDGQVAITLDGLPRDDPSLPTRLQDATGSIPVVVQATPGPRTTIGTVEALGPGGQPLADLLPGFIVSSELGLGRGAPARGSEILAAEQRLLAAVRTRGYAYAQILPRSLVRDPAARSLAVTIRVDPGAQVRIGRIEVEGLETIDPGFVNARMAPREGQPMTPAEIEAARRALLNLGVFAVVRARTAPAPRPDGTADLILTATERPRRIVSLRGAYATSEGGSVGASWTHRNLLGRAERLELSGEVNRITEGGPADLGYRLGLLLTKPDLFRLDQMLQVNLAALREITEAYDKTSVGGGLMVRRPLSSKLTGGLGLQLVQSRIEEAGDTSNYTLLGIPATLTWNDTEEGLDRRRGSRAEITVTPYPVARGSVDGLTTLRTDAMSYLDLGGDRRTILALRAQAGVAFGASSPDVPADLRMYAGGSGTIRGFAFQSVGPLDSSGRPLGGTTMVAASAELRQRIGEQWGAVGFIDTGGVSGGRAPDWPPRIATGVGVGVRYHTVIGPIRADIGIPVAGKRDGDADWQFYFGIGQAF
jgi:translocation and assembly module TamA